MSMTNQQGAPEAMRPEMLDDLIETFATAGLGRHNLMRVELPRHQWAQLAVALSRLHAENERLSGLCDKWNSECDEFREDNKRLAALVEAQQPATHVQNPAEIAHVAGDVSKNGPESNMAQQHAPSAAAAVSDEDEALDLLATLFDAWENGTPCYEEPESSDGFLGHAFRLDDEVFHRCADLLNRRRGKQPSPTPQADSQPAAVADGCTDPYNCNRCMTHPDHRYGMEHAGIPAHEVARAASATADSVQDLQPVHDAVTIDLLNERVAYLERKLKEADSVLEDAARYRWLFGARTDAQTVSVSETVFKPLPQDEVLSHLQGFYMSKAVVDALVDAARKQGGAR